MTPALAVAPVEDEQQDIPKYSDNPFRKTTDTIPQYPDNPFRKATSDTAPASTTAPARALVTPAPPAAVPAEGPQWPGSPTGRSPLLRKFGTSPFADTLADVLGHRPDTVPMRDDIRDGAALSAVTGYDMPSRTPYIGVTPSLLAHQSEQGDPLHSGYATIPGETWGDHALAHEYGHHAGADPEIGGLPELNAIQRDSKANPEEFAEDFNAAVQALRSNGDLSKLSPTAQRIAAVVRTRPPFAPAPRPSFTPLPNRPTTPVPDALRNSFAKSLAGIDEPGPSAPVAPDVTSVRNARVPRPDVIRPLPDPSLGERLGNAMSGMVSGRTGENPVPVIGTAAGMVTAPFSAGGHLVRGLYRELNAQDDAEMRAAEREAVTGGLQLGTMAVAGPGEAALSEALAPVAGEALGRAMAGGTVGSAVGETFTPDDPDVGAALGLLGGLGARARPGFEGEIGRDEPATIPPSPRAGVPISYGADADLHPQGPPATADEAAATNAARKAALDNRISRTPATARPAAEATDVSDTRDAPWRQMPNAEIPRYSDNPFRDEATTSSSTVGTWRASRAVVPAAVEKLTGGAMTEHRLVLPDGTASLFNVAELGNGRVVLHKGGRDGWSVTVRDVAEGRAAAEFLQSAGPNTHYSTWLNERVRRGGDPDYTSGGERAKPSAAQRPETPSALPDVPRGTPASNALATEPEPVEATPAIRSPQGRLPSNLKKYDTQQLVNEYMQMVQKQNEDEGYVQAVESTPEWSESVNLRQSGMTEDAHGIMPPEQTKDLGFARSQAASRAPALARMEAEFTRRGVDPFEYMHAGIALDPRIRQKVADVFHSALSDPFTALRRTDPELAGAADAAIAAKVTRPGIFARSNEADVNEGLTKQEAQTVSHIQLVDRLKNISPESQTSLFGEGDGAAAMREATIAKYEKLIPKGARDDPKIQAAIAKRQALYAKEVEPEAVAGNVPEEFFSTSPSGHIKLLPTSRKGQGAVNALNLGEQKVGATTTARAANKAAGTGLDYETDYRTLLESDMRDKGVAAATNRLYRLVAKRGREITPSSPVNPETETAVTIRDPADVIDDPEGPVFKVALPKAAAQAILHVQKTLAEVGPTTPAGEFASKATRAGGQLMLTANPGAIVSHSRNLAAQLGSIPEPGIKGWAKAVSSIVPGAKQVRGFAEIASTDMTTPRAKLVKAKLAEYGALRPAEKPLTKVEQILEDAGKATGITVFGNNGLDEAARVGMAMKYLEWNPKAPPYEVARYVNKIAGNYTKGLSGAMVDAIQGSKLAMFARIETAKLALGARTLVGQSAIPAEGLGPKVELFAKQMLQGPVGTRIGQAALISIIGAATGKKLAKNAPGHESDIPTGQKTADGKDVYIRGKFLDPTDAAATEDLGVDAAMRGDWVGFRRALQNTALRVGTSGPPARAGFALMGKENQLDREGNFYDTGHPTVSGAIDKDAAVRAALSMTSAGAFARQNAGNPGMPEKVGRTLSFMGANVTSAAAPDAGAKMQRGDLKRVVADRIEQVYSEKDPAKKQAIVTQLRKDLQDSGIANDPQARKGLRDLQRAVMKSARQTRPKTPLYPDNPFRP